MENSSSQPGPPHAGHGTVGTNHPAKKLRGALEMARHLGAVEGLADSVAETFDQLVVENDGMANELLRVYEQLGVVFELAEKLALARSEAEILDTFTGSLKRSFAARRLCVATPQADGAWRVDGANAAVGSWLYEKLARAHQRRTANVETPPIGALGEEIEEVMVAPVLVGDTPVCVLVLQRERSAGAFHASEKMLIQSLALFCGDMIRNFRLVHELRTMSVSMVRALVSAVDQKDPYTCGHSLRVAFYAQMLGRLLKLGEEELRMLGWAALLHDVGKIGIRDDVLKKAGKLTCEEFAHIQEHPVRSHRVVRDVPQLSSALDGILYHHERYNGTGYPEGRAGEAIPLQARIVQVADVFDALTSDRSYRRANDWRRAVEIMEAEAGETLDPALVKLFCDHLSDRLERDPDAWGRLCAEANSSSRLALAAYEPAGEAV